MRLNKQHLFKAIIIGLYILFFMKLHSTGDIAKYINPKYDMMSKIAVGIFFLFFIIQLTRIFQKKRTHHVCCSHCCHSHDHGQGGFPKVFGFIMVAFPLITGFTIPPATLNSSIAANKGNILLQISGGKEEKSFEEHLMESATSLTEKEEIDIYSSDHVPLVNDNYLSEEELEEKNRSLFESRIIEMNEDIFISYYNQINENPKLFEGRTIKLSGFVFKEGDFSENQFVLARYLITHCVADASVIGFLSELEGANRLQQDSWVEIEGKMAVGTYEGYELPIIKVTKWNITTEPKEPYIFPIQTLMQ